MKKIYVLDGKRFSTLDEFYDEITEALVPEAWWGRNLDAFDDILRGGFGTPEEGFVLRWENSAISREKLGYGETVRVLNSMLAKCHPHSKASIAAQIRNAETGTGPTIFDLLVEIIREHAAGGTQRGDVDLELV